MSFGKRRVSNVGSNSEIRNEQGTMYSPLETHLKPLTNCLQLFGLYIPSNVKHENATKTGVETDHSKKYIRFFRMYCYVWFAISTFWVLRYLPAFWVGLDFKPDQTANRVIYVSWMTQCYINMIFILRASSSSDRLPAFYKHFNSILTDRCSDMINFKSQCLGVQKRIKIATIAAWFVMFVNMAFSLYLSFNGANDLIKDPFSSDISFYLFLILGQWYTASWIFPIVFFVSIMSIVCLQFTNFVDAFERFIQGDRICLFDNIRHLRIKHLQLCKCVSILEKDIKFVIGGVYITTLFLSCFIIYQMVTVSGLQTLHYCTYGLWLICNISLLLAISVAASLVNEQVTIIYNCFPSLIQN